MESIGEMKCVVWMFDANMFGLLITITMIGLKVGGII